MTIMCSPLEWMSGRHARMHRFRRNRGYEPGRVTTGNGPIALRPSDGTPVVPDGGVPMGPRPMVPWEAGTSEAAETQGDNSNDGDSSSDETIVIDPPPTPSHRSLR